MNYTEARVYLDQVSKYGSVLGLESMRRLLMRLGNPQDELKYIHISGTNGKGSVLAYLSTVLTGAGYRTGRYISPTLFSYRERIQVDGAYIEKDSLARHVTAIAQASEDMARCGYPTPTAFEMETALAFLYFKEKNCDIVTLETGLGGLLDATNVIKTTVMEVIASISMDHEEVLGKTLGEIARQKAGIIKPNTLVVSAYQEPEAQQVLADTCRENNCQLRTVDVKALEGVKYGFETQSFSYRSWKNMGIPLAGCHQIHNAALALEALDGLKQLGFSLTEQQVRQGLAQTQWKGRFTILQKAPLVILDGAHNPGAAVQLRDSLKLYFPEKTKHFIMGMFRDKDYRQVIELTAPLAKDIVAIETPNNPRALPKAELMAAIAPVNSHVRTADSIADAVETVLEKAGKEDVIVIFGSLSFLAEAEKAVEKGGTQG